jgi:hypothetical protein
MNIWNRTDYYKGVENNKYVSTVECYDHEECGGIVDDDGHVELAFQEDVEPGP